MSARATMPNSGFDNPGMLQRLYRQEPVLVAFAAVMTAMMLPTFVAFLYETRTFNGINVWIKPLKFMSSVAIFLFTMALFFPYLDAKDRARKSVRVMVWAISIIFLLEISYITYRASLAEASHFNRTTIRDEIYYALMGAGILTATVMSGWFGWLMLRGKDKIMNTDLRFAIALGLIAGCVLGSATGAYMSNETGHWVGGVQSDAGGSFFFGWSRTGGDLRVAHFIGLHAMQGIPLIGWLATRYTPANARRVTVAATVLWTAATLAVFVQAMMGRPLFPV
ncbi:MAG: hypothetical protein K2P86_04635 [Xanthobacteraceae bacterium]|nr:hypothetical protein [Xanthobacteraceae bacterium]